MVVVVVMQLVLASALVRWSVEEVTRCPLVHWTPSIRCRRLCAGSSPATGVDATKAAEVAETAAEVAEDAEDEANCIEECLLLSAFVVVLPSFLTHPNDPPTFSANPLSSHTVRRQQ